MLQTSQRHCFPGFFSRGTLRRLAVAASLTFLAAAALSPARIAAQPIAGQAGEVESVRGVGFVQTPGQVPRSLSKGVVLLEGDRLTTASNATAILVLKDGTRMTVRPETDMVLTQYRYAPAAPDNAMLLNLFKGGLRALTGLISKGSPNAARIQSSTVTVGIRGTDFDMRLCQNDCATESRAIGGQSRALEIKASARLIALSGDAAATNPAGQQRRLANGAAIYPDDVVETGPGAYAVLAFRDESRLTLGASTRLKVDQFAFDADKPAQGRFLMSLLKGTLRAFTGLIGKANNRNVAFTTATATVGIRGTGLDLVCTGVCAGEAEQADQGFSALTWFGSIEVTPGGQTVAEILLSGQGIFINTAGTRPINALDLPLGPRPDGVEPPAHLFSTRAVDDAEEGLYVYVRDGHIEVVSVSGVLQLGRNEVGFVGPDGRPERALQLPRFIEFDRVPLPATRQFGVRSLLSGAGLGEDQICR
jgi:hypothetical protein